MPLDFVCEPVAAFAKELTRDLTVGWPGVIRMPRVRTPNDFHSSWQRVGCLDGRVPQLATRWDDWRALSQTVRLFLGQ